MDKNTDKDSVKEILTLKSGKFRFTRKFSNEKLSVYFIEARILYKTVTDLPILPDMLSQIEEEIIRRSIFGTAALEGNPLPEERVGQIITESNRVKRMGRAEKEIWNLKKAYDLVATLYAGDPTFKLTEKIIKDIHELITLDIEHEYNAPGKYRNHIVKVGNIEHGGVYTPPKCLADITSLMKKYVTWMNSKAIVELDPAIRAALAHYYLGLIHPFADGNGRTARLIEALLLRIAGIKYVPIMLSNYYYKNIDDYFWAFSNARKNKEKDVTAFLEFVLKGLVISLNEIKERITYFIRKVTLRDYYAHLGVIRQITQRQHDLLIVLLDHFEPFSLKDLFDVSPFNILYRNVSEKTARRDLKKLHEKDLLNREKGRYELNFYVLG